VVSLDALVVEKHKKELGRVMRIPGDRVDRQFVLGYFPESVLIRCLE